MKDCRQEGQLVEQPEQEAGEQHHAGQDGEEDDHSNAHQHALRDGPLLDLVDRGKGLLHRAEEG